MIMLLQLIIFLLSFIFYEYKAIAFTSIVIPVNKHTDASKPVYSAQIITAYIEPVGYTNTNFLIDIDAPFTWHECILQLPGGYPGPNFYFHQCPVNKLCTYPVSCEESQCTDMRTTYSYKSQSCAPLTNGSFPDFNCTCPVNVVNPFTRSCGQAIANTDDLVFNRSDGENPYVDLYSIAPNAACVSSSELKSFPSNVYGVVALSSSPYALSAYLSAYLSDETLERIIALCLPSTLSTPGVLLCGGGPYYLFPHSDIDIRSLLSYTPLLKHSDSFGYFIGVNAIVIKNRSIIIPMNTTTKLSTIEPYTTLRTDIYNGVVRRFIKVTQRITQAKPVAPFSLCFNTLSNGTKMGIRVPNIDFSLQGGKTWSVSTPNSIKQITKDVACLALIDGGVTSEPAIVIGTFQFEDNFLEFNLENSVFGFSSSLLRKQTSCSNFNFTQTLSP